MKSYNHLNLQQKLCKVRKKMPALLRKHYSDSVNYNFVKLDDINKYLTPALNKYGVNFLFVREDASCEENGRKVFVRKVDGVWQYEADLTVEWVNIDRPEERETAVLHLVGTNEMPDKAKGAALTYGMKYYLFSRFNIDQGADEDPDYRAAGAEPDDKAAQPEKRDASAGKEPESRRGQSRPAAETAQAAQELIGRKRRTETRTGEPAQIPSDGTSSGEKQRTPEQKVSEAGSTDKVPGAMPRETAKPGKTAADAAGNLKGQDPVSTEVTMKKQENADAGGSVSDAEKTAARTNKAADTPVSADSGSKPDPVKETVQESFMQEMLVNVPAEKTERVEPEKDAMGFAVASEPTPFDDDDPFLQALQDDIAKQEEAATEPGEPRMTIEEAKKVVCTFGYHMGQTFGEVFGDAKLGRKTLEWTVKKFRGDERQTEAAKLLLAEFNAVHGKQAA